MALVAERGFRRNLGTGKSLSFVRTSSMPLRFAIALTLLVATNAVAAADAIPRHLNRLRLAQSPPENYLVPLFSPPKEESRVGYREANENFSLSMWQAMLPNSKTHHVNASLITYKGKVVRVDFLASTASFEEIEKSIVKKIGKGSQKRTLVTDVLAGCTPYRLQSWRDRKSELFLVGKFDLKENGVTLFLRDITLNRAANSDPSVHIEYEQCIDL